MECEICGREAGRGKQIVLDGSTMIACQSCASFGKEIEAPAPVERPVAAASKPFVPLRQIRPPGGFRETAFDLGFEIVPDFGKVVRRARESKGLTTKELAMKIFEKESLLHRIENQAIKPSDSMIEKLEKQLGIKLRQKIDSDE